MLPNTVRKDKRLEELTSTFGVLSYLNNVEGLTHTMLRLLPNSGPVDMSHLTTSDINIASTVPSAVHVIVDQLNHLSTTS